MVENNPSAAKVADKQPWERELERLLLKLTITDRSTFAGFNMYGFPAVKRADDEQAFAIAMTLDSLGKSMLRHLWPIEKLRRVVESGQGSAEVPKDVARQCFGFAPGPLRTITAFWSADGFALRCGASTEPTRLSPSVMLSAIHAAGNEMVSK